MVVLGCVVLICFVELSFIFVIYILLLKKSGCVVFLECSAPSCDRDPLSVSEPLRPRTPSYHSLPHSATDDISGVKTASPSTPHMPPVEIV